MERYPRKYYRYGQAQLEMIDAVQEGLISGVFYLFTQLPEKLKPFFKNRGQKRFRKVLSDLQEKGIISLSGDKIKLTKKGKELQKQSEIGKIEISQPKKWDRVWRLISYDIPEKKKRERVWFQRSLKQLDFYKIHESLWVYPFKCEEEVAVIADYLGVNKYVVFMITDHLPKQEKIQKIFGLN